MYYSPLQIYLAVLTGRDITDVPLHPAQVKEELDKQIKSTREKEIYLSLLSQGRYGSLLYVLNRLREEAGVLHVTASVEVLRAALEGKVATDNAIDGIKDLPIAGQYYHRIKERIPWQEQLESIYTQKMGNYKVGFYIGGKKPYAVAKENGYDLLAILRPTGSAQIFAFGHKISPPNNYWKQPHDDMILSNPPRTMQQFVEEVETVVNNIEEK